MQHGNQTNSRPPFAACPYCNLPTGFKVVNISENSYSRQCDKCKEIATNILPTLKKAIIYIDQFALSNMMRSIHPETRDKRDKADPFWRTLFGKLDRLSKLQLIAIPMSSTHEEESRMTKDYKRIERVNFQLSGGRAFKKINTIKRDEVLAFLPCWLEGKSIESIILNRSSFFENKIDGWQSKIIVNNNLPDIEFWSNGLREMQKETAVDYNELLKERWEQQKNMSTRAFFEYVLLEEADAFGRTALKLGKAFYEKQWAIKNGDVDSTIHDLLPTPSFELLDALGSSFQTYGVAETKIAENIFGYLTSPIMRELPFIKISSALQAAAFRKYCAGQKDIPKERNPSILTDIETISAVMPFCDAMMIDNECRNYLHEPSTRELIPYDTILFSTSNRAELVNYLEQIESSASNEHLQLVETVYGANWGEPFYNLFDFDYHN